MKQFKNIAYLYDPEQDHSDIFKWVQKFAAINKAKLSIMHVVEKSTIDALLWEQIFPDKPFDKILQQEAQAAIQKFLNSAKASAIKPLIKVANRNPASELVQEIARKHYDLLVLNNNNTNTLNTRLVKKCPCPVLLGKPFQEINDIKILAAVDPDPMDTFKQSLNIKIINAANALATQLNAELHILYAWKIRYESILKGPFVETSTSSFNRFLAATKAQYKTWLGELAQSTKAKHYTLHLQNGTPDIEIPKFIKKKKITIAVMGTVCRAGIEGFLIGNTAEKVSSAICCSLLTVKPDEIIAQ